MNNLTLHIVNSIPWSNLNRDDTGTPKRLTQGGVPRGQLSSQSIKRAARVDYEASSLGIGSVRSTHLVEKILEAVERLDPNINLAEAKKLARKLVGSLTKKSTKDDSANDDPTNNEKSSDTSVWFSNEEIEAAAQRVLTQSDSDFIAPGMTGSLAIAAFGRMFANATSLNTEAAIAVSPAVSTHRAVIETDYFSTVDDNPSEAQGAGSSYLGVAQFTSGVFYRSITIDRNQLRTNWTGIDRSDARENLSAMATSLIYKLPRGKVNATAPFVMPALVLCEEQAYRMAYDFEVPVLADKQGGFLTATVRRLAEQRKAALRFDPDNFGSTTAIAGTFSDLDQFGVSVKNRNELANLVADWILE